MSRARIRRVARADEGQRRRRLSRLAVTALISLGGGMAGMSALAPVAPALAAAENRPVSIRQARLLLAATLDPVAAVPAEGEGALALNAALPFSSAPVEPASAFRIDPVGAASDYQRALLCLTQAVYYEAGYEPVAGRRAVAQVVLNRLAHPAFPKSLCGVVYQGARQPVCQFSFTCDGSLDRRPAAGAWAEARAIAAAALSGRVEASVGRATHYHADYVAPRWAPMLTKIVQTGAHIFYRWPGSWGRPAAFRGRYLGEPADAAQLRPAPLAAAPLDPLDGPAPALAEAGPRIARAANDVGGLLDPSKGWTLAIPTPGESGAAARAVASRQADPSLSQPGAAGADALASR